MLVAVRATARLPTRVPPPLSTFFSLQVKAAAWGALVLTLSSVSNWSRTTEMGSLLYAVTFSLFSLASVYVPAFQAVRLLPARIPPAEAA